MEINDFPSEENRKIRQKLELPFVEKRDDWGSWVYDHRIGICMTVIIYLLIGIAFVTAKIVINDIESTQGFYIEMEKELIPESEKIEIEQEKMEQMTREQFNEVKNIAMNANAKLDAGLKDDKGTKASDIYNEAKALEDKLSSGRQSYERGMQEEQDILNSRNQQKKGSNEKREESRVNGRVTVTYSLDGRRATYLHIPAYQCEGGGEIVVGITVNRNGKVIAASISRGSGDNCLQEMAVAAAYASKFNVDGSAPDKQQGTITYLFIPQ